MKVNSLNVGYRLVRNATPTADKAPYTGIAIPVGSLAYDNILSKMIDAGTFMTKATAQFCLNAFYEYAAEEIAEKTVRINMGPVAIYPMIGGSFDSEDDEYREPRNSLYVGATLSREIRDAVAGLKPDFLGDEAAAGSVKINSVFDLASMVDGVIAGTEDFRLCGIDLTVPDGDDESLTLVKADGVTKVADIIVSETEDGQRITCHLSSPVAVPKGQYKVRLVSHGLDPTAPLSTVTKKVTLVEAVPAPAPHFDSATSEGCREGYVMPNSKVTVTGVGLRVPAADESLFVDMPEGKGRANFTDVSVSADGTTLTAHVGDWPEGAVPGNGYVVWLDAEGATIAVCEVEVGT